MTPELESSLSGHIKKLARCYADGQFNKGEYRRRRREILVQCAESIGESIIEQDSDDNEVDIGDERPQPDLFWWRFVGGGSLLLICGAGYLLFVAP